MTRPLNCFPDDGVVHSSGIIDHFPAGVEAVTLLFRVTFDALKHRDVAEVERMLERLVSLVARLALSVCEPAEIDRMLNIDRLDD